MSAVRIGVISDTHGLLRTEATAILRNYQTIIHAGDIDQPQVLQALEQIAPTTAVRGNMDVGSWANKLKITERLQIGNWSLVVVHNINDFNPTKDRADVVIFGHSHRFLNEERNGVLFLNPGSAGPRRFSLPITMAVLTLGEQVTVEKVTLKSKA